MVPNGTPPEDLPRRRRIPTIAAAFAVFVLAIGIFAVPALRLSSDSAVALASGSSSDYPPPPSSGYWVLFPTRISQGDGSRAQVFAWTNLPDGTLYQTGAAVFGSAAGQELTSMYGCCFSVRDGLIGLEADNDSCNTSISHGERSAGFSVTVTVTPAIQGHSAPPGVDDGATVQPNDVQAILGGHFERLVGDQVKDLPDGSGNELVATASYQWPEPQCGP
jgi:hypothetical protein